MPAHLKTAASCGSTELNESMCQVTPSRGSRTSKSSISGKNSIKNLPKHALKEIKRNIKSLILEDEESLRLLNSKIQRQMKQDDKKMNRKTTDCTFLCVPSLDQANTK